LTIASTKPFKEITGLKKIEIKYSSKSGAEVSFTLSLVFACTDAFTVKSD